MPFWPIPPIIALVGTGIAITQQKQTDLIIVGVIIVVGVIYYFGFLQPRKDRYWSMTTDPATELAKLEAERRG
jgi:hypothetical protein